MKWKQWKQTMSDFMWERNECIDSNVPLRRSRCSRGHACKCEVAPASKTLAGQHRRDLEDVKRIQWNSKNSQSINSWKKRLRIRLQTWSPTARMQWSNQMPDLHQKDFQNDSKHLKEVLWQRPFAIGKTKYSGGGLRWRSKWNSSLF